MLLYDLYLTFVLARWDWLVAERTVALAPPFRPWLHQYHNQLTLLWLLSRRLRCWELHNDVNCTSSVPMKRWWISFYQVLVWKKNLHFRFMISHLFNVIVLPNFVPYTQFNRFLTTNVWIKRRTCRKDEYIYHATSQNTTIFFDNHQECDVQGLLRRCISMSTDLVDVESD